MNPWVDSEVVAEVKTYDRYRLALPGLWTEVCIVLPVVSALEDGYRWYIITHAGDDVSAEMQGDSMQHPF
jgi:hypothetical protein